MSATQPFTKSALDHDVWYPVERITGKRVCEATNAVQYELKWKNWPAYVKDWKYLEEMQECEELIEEFEAELVISGVSNKPNSPKSVEPKPKRTSGATPNLGKGPQRRTSQRHPDPEIQPVVQNINFPEGSVIGTTISAEGNLEFLIKNGKFGETLVVPALQATLNYPDAVAKFYRSNK